MVATVPDEIVPPQDLLAEQSVLGAMMLSRSAVFDVLGVLEGADFYTPRHEFIWNAISVLAGAGEPVDAITVGDQLGRDGLLGKAGGAEYLHQLTGIVPTAANAAFYADIVREKAIKRRLVEAGIRITQMGYSSEGEAVELAESARAELDVAASNARAEVSTIGSVFNQVFDSMQTKAPFILTPWREINDLLGGIRRNALYVIGARPGEGKTMMGMQLAEVLARTGPVAFSSLEMSTDQLLMRLIASRARVHMTPLMNGFLTDEHKVKIAEVRSDIQALPLFVDDRSGVTVTQIKAFARSVSRKGRLAGVVVDYAQLITGGNRNQQRWEVVGEISQQLKVLSRDLECPVILLAQLNRESVKGRRAPTLADLRESGSLEQDADVVLLMQREHDKNDEATDRLNVYVAKNRHGRTGMRSLLWEGQFARLASQSWGYRPEPVAD